MSNASVVVVGSSNMDVFCYTDRLPEPGETLIGERYRMALGGKGANQAVAARLLGAEVTLVGRVGDDLFGQRMLDNFRSYGMTQDHIQVDAEAGSGVAVILVDKQAENILVVVPGANMRIAPADVGAAAGVIRAADALVMQLEIPPDAIQRAVDIAHEGDTLCVLNPAPARPLPDAILEKVDLLTPNQIEAKMLTGIPAHTLEGAVAAGRALLDKGVQSVIITLGARGALIVRPGETTLVEGVSVDAVDTTGAGDAFTAGLAVGLAEGKTLEQATRFANLAGALSATKPGAMPSLPTRDEVEAFARALESQTN
jgi:ribokinase